jgi:putative radical SAM enzyme (TIGR03279 family)
LEVAAVAPGSIAAELGIEPGDRVLSADGRPVRDLIDFTYACAGEAVELTIAKKDGSEEILEIEKEWEEELGLSFVQATSDGIRRCRNHCLFCFVDQMPRGLRPSLYVKDDDWRLSVLQGNFITLTNLSAADFERIIKEHLSPLYISVHTLDGPLRQSLMRNPQAARIREQLEALATAGIELHCQLVLCPGLNDGPELERTVNELARFWPAVASVAAVPVGLTRFRNGLPALSAHTPEMARALIDWAQKVQAGFRSSLGATFFYLADEFYALAGVDVPPAHHYDGYPQLENGVGLIRRFLDELANLPEPTSKGCSFTLVTGTAAAPTINKLAAWWNSRPGWHAEVQVVQNSFWGPSVRVAGLLTAQDLLVHFRDNSPTGPVFLPRVMFSSEGLTLDDWTFDQLREALGCEVKLAASPKEVWEELVKGGEGRLGK